MGSERWKFRRGVEVQDVGVSKNSVFYPKSSILMGFGTIINHPFWGVNTLIFGSTPMFLRSGGGGVESLT